MTKLILTNHVDEIVACLYIEPDGTLHEDSWLHPQGWIQAEDPTNTESPRSMIARYDSSLGAWVIDDDSCHRLGDGSYHDLFELQVLTIKPMEPSKGD